MSITVVQAQRIAVGMKQDNTYTILSMVPGSEEDLNNRYQQPALCI